MGMLGHYTALDSALIQQIASGEVSLEDLNPYELPGLDIDKTWQALHYVLCGEIVGGKPPLGYVVPMLNDNVVVDFGDFGAFYLYPEQVEQALQAMSEIDREALRSRYDLQELIREQIYPVLTDEDGDEFFDYLATYFEEIRKFYTNAVAEGKGIVFYIS